ncbi:TetR family transcriptional regulator [Erythrobacter sp. 3-20A1M]|uniref:TetR/AcrR family transcriptional regulator n=1 Tax=Erythrobacter sp. 3-20A1M TaxID=2653850 RepID=UPI001BFC601B|nr:TetR family transcriptional regulator [Erythrobacter sp. 3-20A1M]QWC57512.1 TetR family transcriptional regulator [Erythrobacter sp. 3-20A1M]
MRKPDSEIDRNELFEAVWSAPLSEIASTYHLSPGGLAKLCDRLGIPRPKRNYWRMTPGERLEARPEFDAITPAPQAAPRKKSARRSRLPLPDRRAQLLDIAAQIVAEEGVDEVSLNRVAREAGISEAQAHNCFARRIDLLAELARREVDEFERSRKGIVLRGRDRLAQVVLSTVNYLDEAGRRGALLQAILLETEVREVLRSERDATRALVSDAIVEATSNTYRMSKEEAFASNWLITAIALRAGRLVSNGSLSTAAGVRLCLPMVMGCMRSNAQAAD